MIIYSLYLHMLSMLKMDFQPLEIASLQESVSLGYPDFGN
jgi:hypothetical protein